MAIILDYAGPVKLPITQDMGNPALRCHRTELGFSLQLPGKVCGLTADTQVNNQLILILTQNLNTLPREIGDSWTDRHERTEKFCLGHHPDRMAGIGSFQPEKKRKREDQIPYALHLKNKYRTFRHGRSLQ
ncbi:hypothetical protein ADUPG1_002569 [Aduncisulcus paluster]|uniref:Uncharacterized protein n=1 Tax=Aduncisulcus paluster TaxID=2918883 RepID=A0ABQ5KM92_9EUKA|nr:hypothetical protein ADUPG1_002569 [Aduncisulcus paluster]